MQTRKLLRITYSTSGYRGYVRTKTNTIDRNFKNITTKSTSTFPNDFLNNFISVYDIDEDVIDECFDIIEDLTKEWKKDHISPNQICDGGSWDLTLHYDDGTTRMHSGRTMSACNPDTFEKFISVLFSMIDNAKEEENKLEIEVPEIF